MIDTKSGDKVDFFLLQRNEKSELEFSRRRPATILGIAASIASPEDTVLSKLEWNLQIGEQKVEKAFELTELTRKIMRDGIRADHPDATEEDVQRICVDRLLSFHGLSLAEIRERQASERDL